jgi:anti-sigma28 factor (negative regulator of flagellin synthesis)
MISQIGTASFGNAYASSALQDAKDTQKATKTISKQGDTSKVDRIKESLASGEYKINLEALSQKIAQELL